MVCGLGTADTAETLLLLRIRPLQNVFLDHVVRAGGLGHSPGCFGYRVGDRLEAVMLIGPLGGTTLEVLNHAAFAPLAQAANNFPIQPRHIVGHEQVTMPFWREYSKYGARPVWERREPFYIIREKGRIRRKREAEPGRVAPAIEADLDEIVENSAQQYREDLRDDPYTVDPVGFRLRHRIDIQEHRWWILREAGRIRFQAHVGPRNHEAVQIGGVFTPPAVRHQGIATRGMAALAQNLLENFPAVTLFCNEDNHAACGLYDKVGFEKIFYYRSWLLENSPT